MGFDGRCYRHLIDWVWYRIAVRERIHDTEDEPLQLLEGQFST